MSYFISAGFVLIWLLCGFIASGFTFAYFQRKYAIVRQSQFVSDQMFSLVCYVFGPVALFVDYFGYSSYGWLNPWGKKAKIEAGVVYKVESQ